MENTSTKKLLILYILDILKNYSDVDHKLRQNDIMRLLKSHHCIECERKAVARNIEFLQEAGYEIVSDKTGSYLAGRKFEAGELRLLIDSVLSNRNICKKHTRDLIVKLVTEGGSYFKSYAQHVVNLDDWQKENSYDYFLHIELLCEAMDKRLKVKFFYMTYGIDKKSHKKTEEKHLITPYQLLLKNGRYYLMCNFDNHENMAFCRVDHISDLELTDLPAKPLTEIVGYSAGINLGKLSNRLPYLFDDEPQQIEFLATSEMADEIIDRFGFEVAMCQYNDTQIKVALTASPRAMRFWILQYGRYVEVLTPQRLVDIIKEDVRNMKEIYRI